MSVGGGFKSIGSDGVLPDAINSVVDVCHGLSTEAGWWGGELGDISNPLVVTNKLCLIHSEISEAMEGYRKDMMDDHLPHRKMAEVELADAMIRIMDLAGACGFNLGLAMEEKLEYNKTRSDHKIDSRSSSGGKRY